VTVIVELPLPCAIEVGAALTLEALADTGPFEMLKAALVAPASPVAEALSV
jgi:hypothetical protein